MAGPGNFCKEPFMPRKRGRETPAGHCCLPWVYNLPNTLQGTPGTVNVTRWRGGGACTFSSRVQPHQPGSACHPSSRPPALCTQVTVQGKSHCAGLNIHEIQAMKLLTSREHVGGNDAPVLPTAARNPICEDFCIGSVIAEAATQHC